MRLSLQKQSEEIQIHLIRQIQIFGIVLKEIPPPTHINPKLKKCGKLGNLFSESEKIYVNVLQQDVLNDHRKILYTFTVLIGDG